MWLSMLFTVIIYMLTHFVECLWYLTPLLVDRVKDQRTPEDKFLQYNRFQQLPFL